MSYRCAHCRKVLEIQQLDDDRDFSCISCGCKHFYKERDVVAKTVKAE